MHSRGFGLAAALLFAPGNASWQTLVDEGLQSEPFPLDKLSVESASLLSARQVRTQVQTRHQLQEIERYSSRELPGESDKHGPDAQGSTETSIPPLAKWLLAGAVMGSASLPIILTIYFILYPGSVDSSAQVVEEHGGAVPRAVQNAAMRVYHFGWTFFRLSMFTVYFWFGILKCFGISPAEPLVQIVFREIPFLHVSSADFFCKWFVGGGECLIALGYLVTLLPYPRCRFWGTVCCLTIGVGHVVMVSMLPMVLLPGEVWQENRFPYALTFEGQYIMKNLVLTSGIMLMASDLQRPDERACIGGSKENW